MSVEKKEKKRKRPDHGHGPTFGQLNSHIRNKQVRSEQYAKLKHKAKVRRRPVTAKPLG